MEDYEKTYVTTSLTYMEDYEKTYVTTWSVYATFLEFKIIIKSSLLLIGFSFKSVVKGGKGGTGPSNTTLKLKGVIRSDDPNLLAEVKKTIIGAKDVPLTSS